MNITVRKDSPEIKFNKHWQFCVGSPHATYALRHDWTKQLKKIRDELGIKRVRFHGIFCDDMHTLHRFSDIFPVPGGRKAIEQSFRYCATAYDNILEAGMKPFVELSFMPGHLARSRKKGVFFYKPFIAPPADMKKWSEYIKSFISFLIERYGREEVEGWYFEVWNEPDLKMPFFAGSQTDYFRLYETTVNAIKGVSKNIKVGGPSTSGSKWLPEFLDFCNKNQIPVDFISTHQYAGDPLGGIDDSKEKAKISINPFICLGKNSPETVLEAFRGLMKTDDVYKTLRKDNLILSAEKVRKTAKDKPVFYTEWNLCASFSALCNDTRMVASYVVHSVLNTDKTVDGSSIWCFTDLFEELHPFPEEFHGGFGILTQSGIEKPVFYALEKLGRMPENRIVLSDTDSEISAAAFRDENRISIVCTYPVTDNTDKTGKVFISTESDNCPKRVRATIISENSGNPLKEWEKLGCPQVPSPALISTIRENSRPRCVDIDYTYENGNITTEAELHSNDIYFIDIEF